MAVIPGVSFDWFFHHAVYSRCLGLASFADESCCFLGCGQQLDLILSIVVV